MIQIYYQNIIDFLIPINNNLKTLKILNNNFLKYKKNKTLKLIQVLVQIKLYNNLKNQIII